MTSTNPSTNKFTPFYDPVSLKEPNEIDRKIDQTLAEFMDKEMKIADDEEMNRRDAILVEVKHIFLKWVQQVGIQEFNLTEDEAEDAGGDIFISGSHRLGVRDIGADIDAVCITPNFCKREHFFSSLKEELSSHIDVTNLIAIEGALVPVLCFDFRGVSIDLLFARLNDNIVPKNLDIIDDRILIGLDLSSEKSLNGPRVTNMIPELVGKKSLPNFRIVLRCVRRWAKNRGIYGNKLGYLGGVNCNILVALVCQLYPKASPSTLLHRFFYIYSGWEWPKPVKLNHIQPNPANETREVWNERDNTYHVMPIITPAYPAMNSTANVSQHTLEVMKHEFQKGHEMMRLIISERGLNWDRLFQPTDFFIRYHHYLCCHILGGNEDDENSRSWTGFVESRIRHLLTHKFLSSLPGILTPIHLHPIVFKTQKSKNSNSFCYFIGFNVDANQLMKTNKQLYLDDVIYRFVDSLTDPERGFRGNMKEGMEFYIEHHLWKRLPHEVFESIGGREQARQQRFALGYAIEKKKEINEVNVIKENDLNEISIVGDDYNNEEMNELKKVDIDDTTIAIETIEPKQESELVKLEDSTRKRSSSEANLESIVTNTNTTAITNTNTNTNTNDIESKLDLKNNNKKHIPILLVAKPKPWQMKREFHVPHVNWISLEGK